MSTSLRLKMGLACLAVLTLGAGRPPAPAPLGPGLLRVAEGGPGVAAAPTAPERSPASPGWVHALLRGAPDAGALRELGVRVGARAGDVLSVQLPVARIAELARVPGLTGATLARAVPRTLDVTLLDINGEGLRTRTGDTFSGTTGAGVIVGIVDSGLDWTHPDFQHPDGSTRLLWYWDQTNDAGSPPLDGADTLFSYGSEWTPAQINGGVATGGDPVGHGTHVAGIAVGDGSGSEVDSLRYRYTGVAPNADLIVVGADLFLETGVLDAVSYIFTRAEQAGKAAVVNLSLGTQFGPHDGTTALDVGLDALTGPGRLVVAAAGNDGITQVHAEAIVPPGGADSVTVFVPFYSPNPFFNFFAVDAFYRDGDSLEVTVVAPSGSRWGPYPLDSMIAETVTGEGTLFLAHLDIDPIADNRQVQFDLSDFNPDTLMYPTVEPPADGDWRVVFTDAGGITAGGEVDLWVAASNIVDLGGLGPRFTDGYDPGEEITSPGSAREVITVGAYNTKRCWPDSLGATQCTSLPASVTEPGKIAYFSSRGPTRDNRQKPELVAPGFVVSSAHSRQMTEEVRAVYQISRTLDPDRRHFVFAGTSMAAPHVTGTLALLLEREPDLTPEEARTRLVETIRTDAFTGPEWDAGYGFGKLDAGALLDTTTVPVAVRDLVVEEVLAGTSLRWRDPEGHVSRFTLETRVPEGEWRELDSFSGPGPHRYLDAAAAPGTAYRLWSFRRDGRRELWAVAELTSRGAFRVSPAFPNPFRQSTRFAVTLPIRAEPGVVEVFDASGRRRHGWSHPGAKGGHTLWVSWDGRDDTGRAVAPGMYWVRVRSGDEIRTLKLIRLP